MLLEDALMMIAENYAKYSHRRQTEQPPNSTVTSVAESSSSLQPTSITAASFGTIPERLQPDKVTRRLIGLLSADCELTHAELEQIVSYLQFRQKVLVVTKGLSPDSSRDTGYWSWHQS